MTSNNIGKASQNENDSLHDSQGRAINSRNERRHSSEAHQCELKERVVLANGRRMNFGRRQGKVPISGKCLGGRQRNPAVVDGGDTKADVSAENDRR